jgi:hypothetical protein
MFAFRIIADIALKALSPAINDPTTACSQSTSCIGRPAGRPAELRGEVILDDRGQPRVISACQTGSTTSRSPCNEIRACGGNLRRAPHARCSCLRSTPSEPWRAALDTELDLLDWAVKTHFTDPKNSRWSPIRRGWADHRALAGTARLPPTRATRASHRPSTACQRHDLTAPDRSMG